MNHQTPSGLVTGPNLFSYIGALQLQEHSDLADSHNIATKSADLVHHRYLDSKNWFEEYVRTLWFLGWSLYDEAINTRTAHVVAGSVADFLVQSASAMKDVRQANAMIDTLDHLESDPLALSSFDGETRQGETFQIIPTRYDAQGRLNIALYKLELKVETRRNRFLFWRWEKRSATIVQQRAFMQLDRREFEAKRALMKKKLEEHRMRRFTLKRTAP
ncbi:hypothetical protein [Pseudomonas citrulli]|uniref:Uncharacterized protein n=1 Tax=Pseudomonas citrulli TaxID=3064347 RepID=A0ABT9C0T0_9PSED|nr:hypothetical protein [Pseudomonas sp. K18]MDO7898402.1 hypothetical protein [Pseudomonas sp. K18]